MPPKPTTNELILRGLLFLLESPQVHRGPATTRWIGQARAHLDELEAERVVVVTVAAQTPCPFCFAAAVDWDGLCVGCGRARSAADVRGGGS